MGKRRYGCGTVIVAVLATAIIVVAVMVLVGPRLSQQWARLTDRLSSRAPAQIAEQIIATEPPAITRTETEPAPSPAPSPTPSIAPSEALAPQPTKTPPTKPTPMPDAVVLVDSSTCAVGRAQPTPR